MHHRKHLAGILASSALSLGLSAPAFAQAADDTISSNDIIVTARRVEERSQDMPISITVIRHQRRP